jgi:DNA helicase-2/ATP-dependent DNA helicase PcrA
MGKRGTGFTPFAPGKRARPSPAEPSQPSAPHFETGDEVQHEVFGQGIVVESKPAGGDEQVTVAFAGVGLKRLMAGMAPMEKIDRTE